MLKCLLRDEVIQGDNPTYLLHQVVNVFFVGPSVGGATEQPNRDVDFFKWKWWGI